MNDILFSTYVFSLLTFASIFAVEENFILIDGTTDEIILQFGPSVHERVTPCSTFKIALCLIGYDLGILKDETNPIYDFQEGDLDFRESWKKPQTPQSWIKHSCVWYSQRLALKIGSDTIDAYLKLLGYGNQDMSGGLTQAWLGSSLKISPAEQVKLIQKISQGNLPINPIAIQMTKNLLFLEDLNGGWKLFGKTGMNSSNEDLGWFVGWIENGKNYFPFAYTIRDEKIDPAKRIPRVKELIFEDKQWKTIF